MAAAYANFIHKSAQDETQRMLCDCVSESGLKDIIKAPFLVLRHVFVCISFTSEEHKNNPVHDSELKNCNIKESFNSQKINKWH